LLLGSKRWEKDALYFSINGILSKAIGWKNVLKNFKEKEMPKEKIGEWDEANHFPVDVWKKLGDEGILGACFPEQYGGTGGNIIDETLITEEISNGFSAMGLQRVTQG
jgi:alkylation response protein AidB-like acyl-CoA dehydrogenase